MEKTRRGKNVLTIECDIFYWYPKRSFPLLFLEAAVNSMFSNLFERLTLYKSIRRKNLYSSDLQFGLWLPNYNNFRSILL